MAHDKPIATLVTVMMEERTRWVEGYQVIAPNGNPLFPYFRKQAAVAFCKAQGWQTVKREAK